MERRQLCNGRAYCASGPTQQHHCAPAATGLVQDFADLLYLLPKLRNLFLEGFNLGIVPTYVSR
jgi:hypothetical protein